MCPFFLHIYSLFFIYTTASVPGAKEDDYKVDEELNKLIVEESELQQRDEARQLARQAEHGQQMAEESGIGAVSFVSCATGSDSHRKSEDDEDQSQSKLFPVPVTFLQNFVCPHNKNCNMSQKTGNIK
jgi:hypothetical protein